MNYTDISYLKNGNIKQRKAYQVLTDLDIFNLLLPYSPLLAGTIPIEIDVDESDLDIICYSKDSNQFVKDLHKYFSKEENYTIKRKIIRNHETIISEFTVNGFTIEIFGQKRPSEEQEAYRHMIIEKKILDKKGESFRQQIIKLKKSGYKTEPAFAKLLGIQGDPYLELLKY